jgi:hypothetical protein
LYHRLIALMQGIATLMILMAAMVKPDCGTA